MKKGIVRSVLSLVLAGAIAFSGVDTAWTGMETVEAAKVVSKTTLGQVTGIKYDAQKQKITWNKVANATQYRVAVTGGGTGTRVSYAYSPSISTSSWEEGNYTVSIIARDTSGYYVSTASDWDTSVYDSYSKNYIYYKYPAGPAGTATIQISSSKKEVTNAVTVLPGVAEKELQENYVVFQLSSSVTLNKDETIQWQYSNNANFSNAGAGKFARSSSGYSEYNTLSVSLSYFTPGDTMYVRARVYNPNFASNLSNQCYSNYTSAVKYTVPKAKITGLTASVKTTSVTLQAAKAGTVTGYQFAKKINSKWVSLGIQTSPIYVDSGLTKNTKCQYRVRGYSYNKLTQKTTWTAWCQVSATTWGANLNLKAAAASNTSVKLSWNAVADAEGYEVYRYDTRSYDQNSTKGIGTESFSTRALIKTIKGAKTKTYTDKKLTKGRSYTYMVCAYKTVNKQKIYLDDSATVYLKADSLRVVSQYYTATGKKTVTWQKMTGIQGYYVEKYNEVTKQYEQVKKLSAKTTSYTFSKVNVGSDSVTYRIRPYDKSTVYSGQTFTVSASLAAVKNVKAIKTQNGIKVTWSAVAGADYYQVYRSSNSSLRYDSTTKTYTLPSSLETVYEAAINTTNCKPEFGNRGYNDAGTYRISEIRGTSVLDTTLTYQTQSTDINGNYIKTGISAQREVYQTEEAIYNEGPEAGVTYYYYVVACTRTADATVRSIGCTKPASATYTNTIAKKVSKITSIKSRKKGQVTISYKKVSGVDGYAIYRSTKKSGTYAMVGTSTKASFTDASAQSGKTYYYKVASYKKGEAKANIYSAKTKAKKVKVK